MERHIVALGGLGVSPEEKRALDDFVLGLASRPRPRVCFVPTAMGDEAYATVLFYEAFAGRADASHLPLFPWPPANLRDFVLGQDVVLVCGGNTANMLALWRVHGLDAILREVWESGVVLAGWSAGAICWFEG